MCNVSYSDYNEGKDIVEWKRICEEQGIDATSGEGEPAGPSEVDEDPDDAPQITNMWAQLEVLRQLLKHQQQELKEKCTMSTEILGRHKNFMELVKSLDEDMQVYQHAEAQQEFPQQPAIVQGQQHPQPTTLKGGSDPWKPIYQLTHGHVRYKCPQCEHTKMSKGAIFTHLCDVHDIVPFTCSSCGFSMSNHTSLRNHELRHKKRTSSSYQEINVLFCSL